MRMMLAALALLLAAAPVCTAQLLRLAPCTDCPSDADRAAKILTALGADDRPLEHRLRDDGRQVGRIIDAAWPAGARIEGKRVLDVASGGGYLALILSSLVGATGHVDIHNTPGWIVQFPGMDPDRQRNFIKRANIGWVTMGWNELDAAPESYDLILLGQVYHDIVLEGGDFPTLNERFLRMLKPGGRLVVEDHDAIETMPLGQQVNLHRISRGDVAAHFLRAGFEQAGDPALIESKIDNRRMNVFWPTVRGRTDRFILVFRKPG